MPKVGDVVLISNRVVDFPWDDSLERFYGHLGIVLDEDYRIHVPTVHEPDDSTFFYADELTVMVTA